MSFNRLVTRTEPHWTRTGSPDSWEGWIWSYGNGQQDFIGAVVWFGESVTVLHVRWYWTEAKGNFQLIPRWLPQLELDKAQVSEDRNSSPKMLANFLGCLSP